MRAGARWAPAVAIVAAAGALAVGAFIGAVFFRSAPPEAIAPSSTSTTAPATRMKTVDGRSVNLRVSSAGPSELFSNSTGMITESACVEGGFAVSGASALSVNDSPLISLATSQPLWRDLASGDTGPDVRALQAELTRLGYRTAVDGHFGPSTRAAIAALARHAGVPDATPWSSLPYERVVWLPAPTVATESCDARPGSRIEAGDPIASLAEGVRAARIAPLPEGLMPGTRVIVAGDLTLSVDDTGTVTEQVELDRLSQSEAYRAFVSDGHAPSSGADPTGSSEAPTMSVQYQLERPLSVYSVPAASLYGTDGTASCVLAGRTPRAVRIVGSQLGQSLVIPDGDEVLTRVGLETAKAPSCR